MERSRRAGVLGFSRALRLRSATGRPGQRRRSGHRQRRSLSGVEGPESKGWLYRILHPLSDREEYATPLARKAGTERAFSNVYHDHHDKGTYYCAACGNPLFASEAKFESGTGWPSFYQPIRTQGSVTNRRDADGFRDEVRCARCDAHLGHVFEDGPEPTGLRYCMNGTVLHFAAS